MDSTESGSAIAELLIVAPALTIIATIILGVTYIASSYEDVQSIARAAVQAATIAPDQQNASSLAQEYAAQAAQNLGIDCSGGPSVSTQFVPGVYVSVTATCTLTSSSFAASIGKIGADLLGGNRTFTSTAQAELDPCRNYSPPILTNKC